MFDKINYGENFLFLYHKTAEHKQILKNFMGQMANDNFILVYLAHKTNQLYFNFDVQNIFFNVINDEVIQDLKNRLGKCFKRMEKKNKPLFLIADWSRADTSNCETFIPFLEELIKKSQSLNPPVWKRTYKGIRQKTPFMLVNVFETTTLTQEFIRQLLPLHQRVYLFQENLNTFLLPTFSPSLETIFPKSYVLPQKLLEKLVKDNLELITLLFLERNSQSGYQVLKNVAQHFHCILSQGTLYPLLYQLEKENKIKKQNGKGREVLYSLTPEAKKALQPEKETRLRAYQHLASFF